MDSDGCAPVAAGFWHPRRSSRAVPAHMRMTVKTVIVTADEDAAELAAGSPENVTVSDRIGAIPRHILFEDGSVFETDDNDAVDDWLASRFCSRTGILHRLERFHPRLALFALLVVVLFAGLYRYALPAAVELAVAATPPDATRLLGQSVLSSLDHSSVLTPSTLPQERQDAIAGQFRDLTRKTPQGEDAFTLLFRGGEHIGPNAFALPDGSIVLTDALVGLAPDDDAVLGVLAHEMGHVAGNHSLRSLYRAAGATTLILFISGDVGSGIHDILVQGTGLAALSYSREQESEADRYSVTLMTKAGRDPAGLARMLESLDRHPHAEDGTDFFSSHPATPARIEAIRRHAAQPPEG
ncbi:MAG: M48 family metallopeptidase [Rhodospirillaceae bacterium]|nr:M48 family metallopeptidase [Rhodospirillaceae bacterium]